MRQGPACYAAACAGHSNPCRHNRRPAGGITANARTPSPTGSPPKGVDFSLLEGEEDRLWQADHRETKEEIQARGGWGLTGGWGIVVRVCGGEGQRRVGAPASRAPGSPPLDWASGLGLDQLNGV
jgi:hypothetical protein